MNKPVVLRTANIYLRFPEIMEEECDDLVEFLEDEHIVYEGATDVFIEKDKEIERLNKECDTYMKIAVKRQERIDKAIEYIMSELIDEYDIKNGGCVSGSDLPVYAITPILEILKGEDK